MSKHVNNIKKEGEAPTTLTEQKKTSFLLYPLKVITSPIKAFREIAQNPDYKGLILIVGLVVLAAAGTYSAYSARVFFLNNGTSTSVLASQTFSDYILAALAQTALLFFFNWLIYAGVLFLVMRTFGEKAGSWRPFFVLVGYAFSVFIIQWVVGALLVLSLPEIHLQTTSWPPPPQDAETVASSFYDTWGHLPAFQAFTYLTFPLINIIDIWLVLLSVIIVRVFSGTTWGKAATISVMGFVFRVMLKFLLGL